VVTTVARLEFILCYLHRSNNRTILIVMKQFFAACALMLGIVSMSVAQEVVTGPSISLDKDVHDYGTIQQGANGACEFTVTNSGTEPLIISRCKGSCGCTVPQCEKSPIAPGNTSAITVKYDTKRIGPINKSVTITSNASNEPTKVIRIKGKVEASDLGNSGGIPVKQPAAGAPTTGKQ
tara:strand:+ start:35 stop:571 length:537 start_codon:yes stop_codon:yes gene_type:complete